MGSSSKKWFRNSLILVLSILVLGLGLLNYFAPMIDISTYQKYLTTTVSQIIQRQFELDDKLFLKLSLKPTVVTGRLTIDNPKWCKTPHLLKAEQAELGVDLVDLLLGKITIDRLILKQSSLNLEQEDSRNNWSFGKEKQPAVDETATGSPVRLDYVSLDGVSVDYYAKKQRKQVFIRHALLKKNIRGRYKLNFDGDFDQQKLQFTVSSNRWIDGQDVRPLKLKLETQLAANRLSADIAIQRIFPKFQASIKIKSSELDIDTLMSKLPVAKKAEKKTDGLNIFDPWLAKIDYVSLDMQFDRLLYSHYEVRDLSIQNRIIQDVSKNRDLFSVKSSGKLKKIINKNMLDAGLSPDIDISRPGRVSFSLNSHGNTLQQLLTNTDISMEAENITGNHPQHYHIRQLSLITGDNRDIQIESDASYNTVPVNISMKTGRRFLEQLYKQDMGHLDFILTTGKSRLKINSTIRNIFKRDPRKVHFRLAGDRLAEWGPMLDKRLPNLKHYQLESRFEMKPKGIKASQFKIKTPDSYLKGKLFYRYGKRATLNVRMQNSYLKLSDLNNKVPVPVPVNNSAKRKTKKEVKVIPGTDLMALLAPKIDLNLEVKSSDLVFSKFTVKGVDLKSRWQDKVLALQIEKGQLAQGDLFSDIYLTVVDEEAAGKIEILVNQLDYGKLMQDVGLGDKMKGKADVNIHLVGFGKDLREFLTHSDGTAEFVGEKGILASKYLRLWGEDIVQQILPFNWFGKEQTNMNCVVGRFDLTDGRLSSDSLLLDTETMTIAGTGAINLANEELAFELMPDPKNVSLISLATPVKIRGTLAKPKIVPHTLGTTWTIGSLLVGLANPAVLIARFAKLGSLGENPCLAAIGKKEGEEEEPSLLKLFKDAVKFIQRPLDKLPDIE